MAGRLAGKVAFITGVARGQGRTHAVRLASEGADIIGLDLAGPLPAAVPYDPATPEDLEETRRLVEEQGRRALLSVGDVRDLPGMAKIVDDGVAELGRLDIVAANAGICIPQVWDEITPEDFGATLDINTTGVWNTVMATAHHLIAAGGGSIIRTSSYAGKKIQPFMVHYTTSKHALVGMTRAFAAELGPKNIRINSVHPGGVATPMGGGDMVSRLERVGESNPPLNLMATTFLEQTWAEPEEISNVVAFLASDESKFITAEHISIDGGSQYF
ncbi:3-ketoacyl-ACP reductase [Dietzia sp. UCD-THP]|uniref:mycofactocin-coupled SDR family oxidoreductase n=1 Tax=Dietzia sp. UCD-THP TaxID=1292020 RepID=UPI00036A8802|nr:mycofactocin-coupled SDR family oxidoreductase [Dietzia sp. UCD-THP]EYT57148.1 3-ketoacyl-ACP reductase [Dietzia sp. UCD-THP]